MPWLLFFSLYFDFPEQLSDVIDTSSIAENLPQFTAFGVTYSWVWVAATAIATLQWVILRRSVLLLDEFIRYVNTQEEASLFWSLKASQYSAKGGWINTGTAKLINLLHRGPSAPGHHVVSMRIALIGFLQVLIIMVPAWIVICVGSYRANYMPAIAYYCAFLLLLQIGTGLSTIHLAFNAGHHWAAFFSILPMLLLLFALFATGISSLIAVGICFGAITWGVTFLITQIWPVRKWVTGICIAIGLAVVLAFPFKVIPWKESDVVFSTIDGTDAKFRAVKMKTGAPTQLAIPGIPKDEPLVLMTMGGGGSRAAIFNGIVLERLWWINPLSLEDQQIARFANDLDETIKRVVVAKGSNGKTSLYPGRLLLIYTRFVSSVSGGSMTLADWSTSTLRHAQSNRDGKMAALTAVQKRALALEKHFLLGENLRFDKDGDIALSRGERPTDVLIEKIEENPRVKKLRANFLSAVICGAFNPSSSRVNMLAEMWNNTFHWNPHDVPIRMSDLRNQEEQGVIPYALLNTTRTKNGERMAITNLDQEWFHHRANFGVEAPQKDLFGGLRFNTLPGRVTTHSWFNSHWDPTIAHAVFASSDFPFGFPIHQFVPEGEKTRSNEPPEGSTDGGVLENTGTNTAISLVRSMVTWRDSKIAGELAFRSEGADKMRLTDEQLKALCTSIPPIFLLQIDTSALPSNPGPPWQILYNIFEVRNTMQRAKQIQEQSLLEYHVDELGDLVGKQDSVTRVSRFPVVVEGIPREYAVGFESDHWAWYNIRAGEFDNENVPTSWHLSKRSRRVLYRLAFSDVVTRSLQASSLAFLHMLSKSGYKGIKKQTTGDAVKLDWSALSKSSPPVKLWPATAADERRSVAMPRQD